MLICTDVFRCIRGLNKQKNIAKSLTCTIHQLFSNYLNKCLNIDDHCSFRRARSSTVQINDLHTDNPPENSEQNYINPVFDGKHRSIILLSNLLTIRI